MNEKEVLFLIKTPYLPLRQNKQINTEQFTVYAAKSVVKIYILEVFAQNAFLRDLFISLL